MRQPSLSTAVLTIGLLATQLWIGTLQSRLKTAEDSCRAARHASIWQAGELTYCRKELAASAFMVRDLEERLKSVEKCMVCEVPELVADRKPE